MSPPVYRIKELAEAGPSVPSDAALAELREERDRLVAHLKWIGQQFCDRAQDSDVRVCPQSDDYITEWCLPCYAWAALRGDLCDECGQDTDGCYCAGDAEPRDP